VAASVTASAGPAAVTLRKTSQQLAHSDAAWGTAAADQLQQPNIVVVLTDDQTPESVAKMPYVSSRTNWIDVPATHCENCECCPVRAQVLQGRYDTHTQVQNNNQGPPVRRGRDAAGVAAARRLPDRPVRQVPQHLPVRQAALRPAGLGHLAGRVRRSVYNQYNWQLADGPTPVAYGSQPADYEVDVLTDKVSDFVSSHDPRPFFALFTPTSTHAPWVPSPARKGTYSLATVPHTADFLEPDRSDKPAWVRALPPLDAASMNQKRIASWDGAISVDDAVRQVDEALSAAGRLDNTIVVFLSDNGYAFGSHGWEAKRCEYNACSAIPLKVRMPGQPARSISQAVSTVDIASTLSDLARATPALAQDGRSLAPLLLDPAAPQDAARRLLLHWPGGDSAGRAGRPDSLPGLWGLRGPRYKYIELDTGERELYDEVRDRYELRNRAGDPALAGVQKGLTAELARAKVKAGAGAGLRTDLPNGQPMPALDLD